MTTKGILYGLILVAYSFAMVESTRSLFDELIVDRSSKIKGQPFIYDTSSKCRPGSSPGRFSSCSNPVKEKEAAEVKPENESPSRPSTRPSPRPRFAETKTSSLFGDVSKQSLSFAESQGTKSREREPSQQQRTPFTENHYSGESDVQQKKQNFESLFDDYVPTKKNKPLSRSSSRRIELFHEDNIHGRDGEDIDISLRVLEKEKEALENLPEAVWEKALETSETDTEGQESERTLTLLANSAQKLKSLFSEGFKNLQNDRNNFAKNKFTRKPSEDKRTLSEEDLKAIARLVKTENVTNAFEKTEPLPHSPLEENYIPFIEDVKESRLQDLLLALKIMQTIEDSKSRPKKEKVKDEEMEIMLAKSLFKRSITSMDELTASQKIALDSFMKAIHGELNEEERIQAANSISRIFTLPDNDFAPSILVRQQLYDLPSTKPPYRPSPTKSPQPVGPPSPPPVVRPRPPVGPQPPSPPPRPPSPPPSLSSRVRANTLVNRDPDSRNSFIIVNDDLSFDQESDDLFLSDDQIDEEGFFIVDDSLEPINDDRGNIRSSSESRFLDSSDISSQDTFGIIKTQSSLRKDRFSKERNRFSDQVRSPNTENVQHNYHYHYFTYPGTSSGTSRAQEESRSRAFSRTRGSLQRDSTYVSLDARPQGLVTLSNDPTVNSILRQPPLPLQDSSGFQNSQGRVNNPLVSPTLSQMGYGVPPADPPRPVYGTPPQASPPAPPAPPLPPAPPPRPVPPVSYKPSRPADPPQTYGPPRPADPPQTYGPPRPADPPQTYGPPPPADPPQTYGPPRPANPPQTYGPPPPADPPQAYGPPPPADPPQTYGPPPPADPPQTYGLPPPADPPQAYGPPRPANPPQSYGPPPPADPPQMTYGPPPIRDPPAPPPPVRTRVVFLSPVKEKKKFKKYKKKKGLFSAFSVIFGGDGPQSRVGDAPIRRLRSDYLDTRDSLRDEYWRNREELYRRQQEAFELQRLRYEIEMQEKQRNEVKRGLFKNMMSDALGGGIKDMFYKGAMALGAMSLIPLTGFIGRRKRSITDNEPLELPDLIFNSTLTAPPTDSIVSKLDDSDIRGNKTHAESIKKNPKALKLKKDKPTTFYSPTSMSRRKGILLLKKPKHRKTFTTTEPKSKPLKKDVK